MMQSTLAHEVVFEGIGVHTGAWARVRLVPAEVNTGIRFCKAKHSSTQILVGNVIPEAALHATVLVYDGWTLSTVEHLLAAIGMCGIDNLEIIVDGNEIPILDGSSYPFFLGIEEAGIIAQSAQKMRICVKMPVAIADDMGRTITLLPQQDDQDERFYVEYTADFKPFITRDFICRFELTKQTFAQQIAPARTFGFVQQIEYLRAHNLARGSTLGNSLVGGPHGFLNQARFEDEFLRHKVLDLVGDMTLLGASFCGTVKAARTSHSFNRNLIINRLKEPQNWASLIPA